MKRPKTREEIIQTYVDARIVVWTSVVSGDGKHPANKLVNSYAHALWGRLTPEEKRTAMALLTEKMELRRK